MTIYLYLPIYKSINLILNPNQNGAATSASKAQTLVPEVGNADVAPDLTADSIVCVFCSYSWLGGYATTDYTQATETSV